MGKRTPSLTLGPFIMMLGTLKGPLGKPSGTKTAFPGEMSCHLKPNLRLSLTHQANHKMSLCSSILVFCSINSVPSRPLTTLPTVLLLKYHISDVTLLPNKTLSAFYCFRKQHF